MNFMLRKSAVAAMCFGIAMTSVSLIPSDAQAQLFQRLFNRNCCPPPPCCVQSDYGWQHGSYSGYYSDSNMSYGGFATEGTYSSIQSRTMIGLSATNTGEFGTQRANATINQDASIGTNNQVNANQSTSGNVVFGSPAPNQSSSSAQMPQENPAASTKTNMTTPQSPQTRQQEGSSTESSSTPEIQDSHGSEYRQEDGRELTQLVAGKMYLGNQCVIQLAEMAQNRAENDEIKKLADELVSHHSDWNQKLRQFIPSSVVEDGINESEPIVSSGRDDSQIRGDNEATTDNSSEENRVRVGRVDYDSQVSPLVQKICEMEKSAFANAQETLRQEMEGVSGDEFERKLINLQCMKHQEMLACLKAIDQQDVGELNDIVDQAISQVENHLNRVEEIKSSLDTKATDRDDQLPGLESEDQRNTSGETENIDNA